MPGVTYQAKFCTIWKVQEDFPWFPAKRIFINKEFKEKLYKAFKKIEEAHLQNEIHSFDGCYQERKVRGSSAISLHSWAMAIDLNASMEKLGQTTSHFSGEFIKIMTEEGIYWGGNYQGRKDPMHFSLYNG